MKIFLCVLMSMLFCVYLQPGVVFAEIVTGQAYIENGNISKASANARKNAISNNVEENMAFKVKSNPEDENNFMCRDTILQRRNA